MAEDRDRQLIATIAAATNEIEKEALPNWASQLLAICESKAPPIQKAKQAIKLTLASSIVWPTVKIVAREIKRLGWNDRSWAGRFGLAGAAIGLTVFSGSSAGIVALGTGIGVPLWIVLGSGSAFAGVLVDELSRKK